MLPNGAGLVLRGAPAVVTATDSALEKYAVSFTGVLLYKEGARLCYGFYASQLMHRGKEHAVAYLYACSDDHPCNPPSSTVFAASDS
jgi:hypothetical protein